MMATFWGSCCPHGHTRGGRGQEREITMSGPYLETNLSPAASDLHRALASLQEELEAVDYYHQRAEKAPDGDLRAVLLHNRDEEIEHACMLLEWVRRTQPAFDAAMRTYLFQKAPITAIEAGAGAPAASQESLGIGKVN